jgi:hypothetical protein
MDYFLSFQYEITILHFIFFYSLYPYELFINFSI